MSEKKCIYCGAAIQGQRTTRKFCDNGGKCKQAHYRREHDPLLGSEARAARKTTWLDGQKHGQLKKWVTRDLAKRELGFSGAERLPADIDQDPRRQYGGTGVTGVTGGAKWLESRTRLKGPWEDKTLLGTENRPLTKKEKRQAVFALLHQVVGIRRSDPLLWNLCAERFFEVALVVENPWNPDGSSTAMRNAYRNRETQWQPWAKVCIEMLQAINKLEGMRMQSASPATMILDRLDRIERLESMRAETMDRVRETVEKIAAHYPDDVRIQDAAQDLLDES
jgi:hypothetical protein